MSDLAEVKREIATDLRTKISLGVPINDEIFPVDPAGIEVVGKSLTSLQARITYQDRAYYFSVAVSEAVKQ